MKEDFTTYDIKPLAFLNYLQYYGQHFNKKLCDYACSFLRNNEFTKESLDTLLSNYGIKIINAKLYDAVYVANWCKSIFYGSSILDDKHLIFFLKDIFEKEDNLIFNRWIADAAKMGIPIEWEDMI